MTGSWWWYAGPRDGQIVPDYPPVYLGEAINEAITMRPIDRTPTTSDMRTEFLAAMERLAQPPAPEDLTVTITADTTRWEASMRQLLVRLGSRYTVECPGCRRDVCCHEYNLAADSCRACLEIIPRLQKTMRGARVDWAPISPELRWRTTR